MTTNSQYAADQIKSTGLYDTCVIVPQIKLNLMNLMTKSSNLQKAAESAAKPNEFACIESVSRR